MGYSRITTIRAWKAVQKGHDPRYSNSFRFRSSAELYVKQHNDTQYSIIPWDIPTSELPPWSWLRTMTEKEENKGVLTNWDNFTNEYLESHDGSSE